MKVLWLCSTPTPNIAKDAGIKCAVSVSWIVNALNCLTNDNETEVAVCFPVNNGSEVKKGCVDNVKYYGFPQAIANPTIYNEKLESYFDEILKEYEPDIIHVWGTEYPHTLSMVKACEKNGVVDKAIISIQGLCSYLEKHYYAGLSNRIVKRYTIRDLLKRENIAKERENYIKRGKYEIEALKRAKNVIGRTDWDKACTTQINKDINYYFCNETLRDAFYNNKWDEEKCEKHSIFISQGYYPLKGLHLALEAVNILKREYDDIRVYVGGLNMTNRGILRTSSYGKYINEIIQKYDLKDRVVFTGSLDEEKMCQRYLDSNVFVCPSSIENSPNSVGEAMILGMPVVSSDVGGVKNLMEHNKEGYIYPYDAPYMLAYYIKEIFENSDKAAQMGKYAREHALNTHNKERNTSRLLEIYKEIVSK